MKSTTWPFLQLAPVLAFVSAASLLYTGSRAEAGPKPGMYWKVEDVRPGMKGHGRTVLKGTKAETIAAEVLGVLKNTSPGRDKVLCRLSGLNLDKTGVIAGMSGSPVSIDGKLLGAVAYAWPFGKEPIAGITPFCQMHGFVEAYERRDLAEQAGKPTRIGLRKPLTVDGLQFDIVTVSQDCDDPKPTSADGLWMVPLRTPLAASGFTTHSLALLRDRCQGAGIVPVQGGGVGGKAADLDRDVPLEAGGPLAVALVTRDFDLSGIGTVTHIEGDRVYGWGHPFFGLGTCEFPLMTGYIQGSKEVASLDTTTEGFPVVLNKHAAEADHIGVVARVKPHTSYHGPIETNSRAGAVLVDVATGEPTLVGLICKAAETKRVGGKSCPMGIYEWAFPRGEYTRVRSASPSSPSNS